MSGIFISYRRDDTSGYAGRIYDRLSSRYGADRVFMDVKLVPGVDFHDTIAHQLRSCTLMLVLVGPRWLTVTSGDGGKRLHRESDLVRTEIATALGGAVRVIPVLVQRAQMPADADLPLDIRKLARLQAIELSDARWEHDCQRLTDLLDATMQKSEPAVVSPGQVTTPPLHTPLRQLQKRSPTALLLRTSIIGVVAVGILAAVASVEIFYYSSRGSYQQLVNAVKTNSLGPTAPVFVSLQPASAAPLSQTACRYLVFEPFVRVVADDMMRDFNVNRMQAILQVGEDSLGLPVEMFEHAAVAALKHYDEGPYAVRIIIGRRSEFDPSRFSALRSWRGMLELNDAQYYMVRATPEYTRPIPTDHNGRLAIEAMSDNDRARFISRHGPVMHSPCEMVKPGLS